MRTFEKGFSFLELLMAMTLLFTVSFFFIDILFGTTHYASRAKEYTTATFLAESKMEKLLPFTYIGTKSEGYFSGAYRDYQYQVEAAPYSPGNVTIKVTVISPHGVYSSLSVVR